jgi:hypothetical protein
MHTQPPTPPLQGIPAASMRRLEDGARTLSRMPVAMASALEVVGIAGSVPLLAAAAERIAATHGLIATVKIAPLLTVRFERG